MSKTQDLITRAQEISMNTYPLQPVVMSHGKGCVLTDIDGKDYLDFAAGIAVAALGHANPKIVQAMKEQGEKFMICPASYMSEPRIKCAELLTQNCCTDKVFFCNSGAEAIEASMKLARLWAHKNKSETCKDFISFGSSFHGRTYGAVSITEKSRIYPEFGPYLPGCHFAQFNDLDSVKALITENICAIIVEPVQGEGGITPATPEFIQGLRALCDEHDILLILDEVQCGMGRIGSLYAHSSFGIEADIIAIAKGMGSGFPVGAMLAKDKFADAFVPGVHGTTYGGNPLATHVAYTVVSEIMSDSFMEHVKAMGQRLMDGLENIRARTGKIEAVRGMGLMVGADLNVDIKAFLGTLRDNGMMATQAGSKTLRLTPPLIVSEREIDEALEKIETTLRDF
ncbi:MAG: aspartate aminotransferase family protein [Alphaproteobacteria bacterium]